MKQYWHELKSRPTHDRRLFAMRMAGAITAIVFVGWIGTLGLRVGPSAPDVAAADSSQTAAAQTSLYNPAQNQLIVATTTN